jgi:Ca2+-binding RTX toxin-like protein
MASVTLGNKAKNYDLDVSDIDLTAMMQREFDLTIRPSADGDSSLRLQYSGSDYIELQGSFSLKGMLSGSISKTIEEVTQITVVENGKVSYSVSGISLTGDEVKDAEDFAGYIASENYKITGSSSNNAITGAGHNDTLYGMDGADKLFGLDGNDKLYGGNHNDFLSGGNFNDRLNGEAGNDTLNGGKHNDVLTGGSGIDTFVFGKGFGADVITDFDAVGKDHDVIDLSGYLKKSGYGDLEITRVKHDLLIEFGDHESIRLEDVSVKDLDKGDFLF